MTKSEAYATVLQDLQKCSVFTGLYDAKNGSRIFMDGVSNVMELIAYGVSEEVGDAFTDLFIDNMVKCEKEAQNKSTNTPTNTPTKAPTDLISRAEAIIQTGQTYGKSAYIKEFAEVVRCKNCKYGEEKIKDYRCWMLDEDWDIRFSPMHFCSYGRRREDGEA